MRRVVWPAVLMLTLGAAAPALASGSHGAQALFDVGPHSAAVTADSPQVHTGTNTFTVELCSLPPDKQATLQLKGPHGQVVNVPLKSLTVIPDPSGMANMEMPVGSDGHAGHNHGSGPGTMDHAEADSMANMPGMDMSSSSGHDMSSMPGMDMGHGSASHDTHSAPAPAAPAAPAHSHDGGLTSDIGFSYHVRGTAVLNETGPWTGTVTADDPNQGLVHNDFTFTVVQGGANRWYLGFTSVLMGGSLAFGVVEKRRKK
ncbi:MAG: hypothetical protein ACM3XM_06830 [Mycobacterium leprae]